MKSRKNLRFWYIKGALASEVHYNETPAFCRHQKSVSVMKNTWINHLVNVVDVRSTYFKADISCLPYWEFFRRSSTWKELNEFEERSDSTMSVDLALVALWEVCI